jgi:SAM-dependent methyltransferase
MTDDKGLNSSDYHDYVIRDGRLVGRFEEMYQNCEDPWPETEEDLEFLPTSTRTCHIIARYGYTRILSIGCGKGMHLNWLKKKCPWITAEGCEISKTAVESCRKKYPDITAHVMAVSDFPHYPFDFDLIIIRETIWYMLEDWRAFCNHLKQKYKGRHIIVELSFYDNQAYGIDFFDGPDEFVAKFPFDILEIVRYHTTRMQREGMIFIYGKI